MPRPVIDHYEYVRNYYGVPAYPGVKVTSENKSGVIVKPKGSTQYVMVRFDGEGFDVPVHPRDLSYAVEQTGVVR